ncbi:hypothetical protein [Pimelobacter simplex]|uniref:hypothetical protein n=1 Tax=Nocardioides simplex TaxID=2045 RepID=UPI00193238B7|nr:hypothetical protein [Pimelobacter simplex]
MIARRSFLTTVPALAASLGLAAELPASAGTGAPMLTAYVGGRAVARTEVLRWEARRVRVVAQRLAHHLPTALVAELDALLRRPSLSTAELARDRALLVAVKQEMGERRIRRLLATDLALSAPASRLAGSLGAWSLSRARLVSTQGTAQGFVDWFVARGDRNDEATLLEACPDHYLLHSPQPGVQEVIEVTGGAVLASRFLIDYADRTDVPVTRDADCPVELAGWATTGDGRRIGAVRHQFRDVPGGGFEARLAIAFPSTLPPWMLTEHRWHLACEFSTGWRPTWPSRPAPDRGGCRRPGVGWRLHPRS